MSKLDQYAEYQKILLSLENFPAEYCSEITQLQRQQDAQTKDAEEKRDVAISRLRTDRKKLIEQYEDVHFSLQQHLDYSLPSKPIPFPNPLTVSHALDNHNQMILLIRQLVEECKSEAIRRKQEEEKKRREKEEARRREEAERKRSEEESRRLQAEQEERQKKQKELIQKAGFAALVLVALITIWILTK